MVAIYGEQQPRAWPLTCFVLEGFQQEESFCP